VFIDDLNAAALLADKAYDADDRVLKKLEEKNCEAVILPKSLRKEPRTYDRILYKSRHLIENFFAKLKQYRAIDTRYDKTAQNFLGGIYLAASAIWLA
jgi:transposase